MRLCNVREESQQVGDGELETDSGGGVAASDQRLVMFVLFDEFVLHRVPHNLQQRAAPSLEYTRVLLQL